MWCNGWVIASFMANQTFDLCEDQCKTMVDAFVTATVWNLKEGYNRPYFLSFYLTITLIINNISYRKFLYTS